MSAGRNPADVLEKAGFRTRIVPPSLADETVRDMAALFASGTLSPDFARRYRHKFRPDWKASCPDARSVLVLAVPAPEVLLRFPYGGAVREMAVPPGYAYAGLDAAVARAVKEAFEGTGFYAQPLEGVPLKLLAVRSGLCRYGRNNITYCEGLGSYHQLHGIVTDMELPFSAPGAGAARMPACAHCKACSNACPTKAIDPDAPIIHAQRCLTFLNENPGDFPAWLDESSHHAIVGCMKCQRACPQNRGRLVSLTVDAAFDEQDVGPLLAGGAFGDLPEKTQAALRAYNLDEYWPQLSRNLKALLKAEALRNSHETAEPC